jgi:hypothetical protein
VRGARVRACCVVGGGAHNRSAISGDNYRRKEGGGGATHRSSRARRECGQSTMTPSPQGDRGGSKGESKDDRSRAERGRHAPDEGRDECRGGGGGAHVREDVSAQELALEVVPLHAWEEAARRDGGGGGDPGRAGVRHGSSLCGVGVGFVGLECVWSSPAGGQYRQQWARRTAAAAAGGTTTTSSRRHPFAADDDAHGGVKVGRSEASDWTPTTALV